MQDSGVILKSPQQSFCDLLYPTITRARQQVINLSTESEKRKLLKLGWLVVIIFVIWTVFSPWGAWKYYRQGKDLEQVREANQQLQQNNQKLQKEIDLLTSNPAYIEKIAREKHGLLRNNEVVYSFPSAKKKRR